jgi:predicted amidophosphoribosyltransferase
MNTDQTHDTDRFQLGRDANPRSIRRVALNFNKFLRARQPVTEVANKLGEIVKIPVFHNMLVKARNGKSLKDLSTKSEKIEAIGDSISVHGGISNDGQWNVLVVDDLFHTGASMETACKALRTYPKVGRIYVAALTWRS